ncbi:MAG: hypothetical protein ACI8TP_003963 [Acidimicrobiales bacterium]
MDSAKALEHGSPASVAVDLMQSPDSLGEGFVGIAEEAVPAGGDDLGGGAFGEGDDGCSAGECFDHYHPKWFWPANRIEEWLDLSFEAAAFGLLAHLGCDHEALAGGSSDSYCSMGAFFVGLAAEESGTQDPIPPLRWRGRIFPSWYVIEMRPPAKGIPLAVNPFSDEAGDGLTRTLWLGALDSRPSSERTSSSGAAAAQA